MKKYAVLCGSAPEGKIQKKIDDMYDTILQGDGRFGIFAESEVMIFPNGIDEANLCCFLNNLRMYGICQIFLYICTVTPVFDHEESVWLCGNEIHKSYLEAPAALSGFIKKGAGSEGKEKGFSVQVVYDCDREFVDENEYFYDAELARVVMQA